MAIVQKDLLWQQKVKSMKNEITILDCTLRDGGYYTDWNFSDDFVRDLISASSSAGVNIIELGYKSPIKGNTYKNCDAEVLSSKDFDLSCKFPTELAFMIDLKEFTDSNGVLDKKMLCDVIPVCHLSSGFSYCRIATHVSKTDATVEAAQLIRQLGYFVIVNIMGISLLSEKEVVDVAQRFKGMDIEALYFADSLGNLSPVRTSELTKILLQNSALPVGFHAHENQGLSLANSLAALDAGATYIDATALGMGRGAGNVRLEQLLLYLKASGYDYNPEPLIPMIEKHLIPLLKQYKWGWSYDYMLTGQLDIHPMYAQTLSQDFDLTIEQRKDIIKSLEFSESNPSSKYSHDILQAAVIKSEALDLKSVVVIPARFQSTRFPGKPLVSICGTPMVIRVCNIAAKAVGAENVYVATDSEEIANVVRQNGFQYIMTGPAETGTDRIAEAAKELDADIIVNVQGDEPILEPEDILKVIDKKKSSMHEVINGMCPLTENDDPDSVTIPKVVAADNGRLLYISRAPIPGWKAFVKKKERVFWKQVCIYAFTKNELEFYAEHIRGSIEKDEDIEILRFLENGYNVRMVKTSGNSIAVDVPEDIIKVEKVLNEKIS